jgi:colanic acid/amylovoran biosynthesis glycosyltransferase
MKLAYVLTTFPATSQRFVAREIDGLTKAGFDIAVLAADKEDCDYPAGVKIIRRSRLFSKQTLATLPVFFARHPLAIFALSLLLARLLIRSPREALTVAGNLHTIALYCTFLDRAHIQHIHAGFFSWPACIGLAMCAATGRTLSIAAHARDVYVERGAANLKLSGAKFVVACSEQTRQRLTVSLPSHLSGKVHLNYHGVDIRDTPRVQNDTCTELVVLAIGRMVPKKGFDVLLEAYSILRRRIPCSLQLIGSGPEKDRLVDLANKLQLNGQIDLSGWKPHQEVLSNIQNATVLVVPSVIARDGDRDGIPNVILEAFAAGTPVVASNLPGISEAVINRQTGLLAEPGDCHALAEAIFEVLNDFGLRQRLRRQAHRLLCERFDLAKNTKELAELFEKHAGQ